MIYLFTGNSSFLLSNQIAFWKKNFIEKNGDFDLLHIKNISEVSNDFLQTNLTASSFFDKKLIIIDDFPLTASEKDEKMISKQDLLESILDYVPENNIVVFSALNPDKRTRFFKKCFSLATQTKDFSISKPEDLQSFIKQRYSKYISNEAISLLMKYKSNNTEKIILEIDKLLISKEYIEKEDILENIFPEIEESIFLFIDNLLNLDLYSAIEKMNIILEQTNIYAFYNNFLANLRTRVFIQKLKSEAIPNPKIGEILSLGNRGFLANKNHFIDIKKLENLYINMIDLDKKMKSGKMIGSEDEVLRFEIEKLILKLK